MSERKCTLCGGKLDSRKICSECGLDNHKSEKNYKVSQSSCDGKAMTHVHGDKSEKEKQKENRKVNRHSYEPVESRKINTERKAQQKQKSRSGRVIGAVTFIFTIAGLLISIIDNYSTDIKYWAENTFGDGARKEVTQPEATDPYAFAARGLAKDGDRAAYQLSSGWYIVGVHLPEGSYAAETENDFDTVVVNDPENSIFLYEYAGKEDANLHDLRLYKGAQVTVKCRDTITLTSENARLDTMDAPAENPLTETVTLKPKEQKTAGEDFEAGIYDAELLEGNGELSLIIYDEYGDIIREETFSLAEDGIDGDTFQHIVLPAGAEVTLGEDLTVKLTPGTDIATTDYEGFYDLTY